MKQIYHSWDKWECYRAGLYDTGSGMKKDECKRRYAEFLSDPPRFEAALNRVISEWIISCEQFLSNPSINRIAWLGQASMCIDSGIPRAFRGGFHFLSETEQTKANELAQKYLTIWEIRHAGKNK